MHCKGIGWTRELCLEKNIANTVNKIGERKPPQTINSTLNVGQQKENSLLTFKII